MPELILVTGGAGFIGSHLCEALLRDGKRVLCVDNFCDFYDPARKHANLRGCLGNPLFALETVDVTDAAGLADVFDKYNITAVCHLAAMAGVRPSIQNPGLYLHVNLSGTLNLLKLCQKHGIKSFVFASSSSVYGNGPKLPYSESDPVDHPISPYAASKKAGELLCHTWHHLWGISILCLRFFTVFGPRQRPDLAIHKFATLLKAGRPLPVYGDGSSSRDYTYIDDTVTGIMAALELTGKTSVYDVINLGNDQSVSLEHMVHYLERVSGIKALRQQLPPQDGDVLHTRADISKAARLLGYNPQTSFEQGLEHFWRWFDQQSE